jgi:hypothetical protein
MVRTKHVNYLGNFPRSVHGVAGACVSLHLLLRLGATWIRQLPVGYSEKPRNTVAMSSLFRTNENSLARSDNIRTGAPNSAAA